MTTFWIRADGTIIHATSDPEAEPPDAVVSTEIAPESGRQIWDFDSQTWGPVLAPEKLPMDAEDIWRVLRSKAIVTDADIPPTRRVPQ